MELKKSHASPPWASLFKNNRKVGAGFKLSKTVTSPGGPVFVEEDFAEEMEWETCLIGCVGGSFPGIGPLKQVARRWKGNHRIQMHDSGWIIFQFDDIEDMLEVLSEGPYFVNGKPLMLKRMPKYFCFGHEEMNLVPIWVRFINLPLILWKEQFLSRIASHLGNPISTDQVTAKRGNFNYARLLIEIDISKEMPNSIDITLPDKVHKQEVYYERVPMHCALCGRIGHTAKGHEIFIKDEKLRKVTARHGGKRRSPELEVKVVPTVGIQESKRDIVTDNVSQDLVVTDEQRQTDVYLAAHSQENIQFFLTSAFNGIGGDVPSSSQLVDGLEILEQEEVDNELEERIEQEIDQSEKFVKVLSRKDKRRKAKALKDHPSKFKDKVLHPNSTL